MKVSDLLSSEDKWCRNAYARCADGKPVGVYSKTAEMYDLSGAINYCYPNHKHRRQIKESIMNVLGSRYNSVHHFNDLKKTDFSDIETIIRNLGI